MRTWEKVRKYFETDLLKTDPPGQFLVTRNRAAKSDGISAGEKLIFSWQAQIIYVGVAASDLRDYRGPQEWEYEYPSYFLVDLAMLWRAQGSLEKLETEVLQQGLHSKRIVRSQGWPRLVDSELLSRIWERLRKA